jgi:hypothetical protein
MIRLRFLIGGIDDTISVVGVRYFSGEEEERERKERDKKEIMIIYVNEQINHKMKHTHTYLNVTFKK